MTAVMTDRVVRTAMTRGSLGWDDGAREDYQGNKSEQGAFHVLPP